MIVSAAQKTPNLSIEELLWRPRRRGLDSSFHTTLSPLGPELGPVPPLNSDLLTLAILTYLADRTAPRPRGLELGTRHLDLSVPVTDPDRWAAEGAALEDLLRFLSGDEWQLSFRASRIKTNPRASKPGRAPTVCLFSGGADSLAGALAIQAQGATPALVSHWDWSIIGGIQSQLVGRLESLWTTQIDHVQHKIGRRTWQLGGTQKFPEEGTSRSRSFLFIALGLAAAAVREADLVIAENGWASINAPLAGERRGAFSTRTTNPAFLDGLEAVLARIGISTAIDNPFEGLTKGDVFNGVRELLGVPEASKLLSFSHSCAKPIAFRFGAPARAHCGVCFGCLVRRGAFIVSGLDDQTQYADEILAGKQRVRFLSANQRKLYETVRYAASKGVSAGDVLELGLPDRISTRDAVRLAQRGLDELAQVHLK